MTVHIGGDVAVDGGEIIAVIAARTYKSSRITRETLGKSLKKSGGVTRSYVLTRCAGAKTTYASPIRGETIRKRAMSPYAALIDNNIE